MASKDSRGIRCSEEGLQVYHYSDAPEVVSGPDWKTGLSRSNSAHGPETYDSALPERIQGEQYWEHKESVGSSYLGSEEKQVFNNEDKEAIGGVQRSEDGRRILGLQRRTFLWTSLAVVLVVIIAVAVGVGVGVTKHGIGNVEEESSDGPLYLMKTKTGLAMVNPNGTSDAYVYYTAASGMIVEAVYENGAWDEWHDALALEKIITNVTAAGEPGSPIAVVSYTRSGATYRQLFFFDARGAIFSMNTTMSGDWSEPSQLLADEISSPGSMSLAACADTKQAGLNGIRVYYASSTAIVELGTDFQSNSSASVWTQRETFPSSDPSSGVACTLLADDLSHLYLRNTSTSSLQQLSKNYTSDSPWAIADSRTGGSTALASGGSIAAISDGQETDFVFLNAQNNKTISTLFTPSSQGPDTEIEALSHAPTGYALAAAWMVDGNGVEGAVGLGTWPDHSDLYFASVERSGEWLESISETGR